jgi:hypothetical protein
MRVIGGRVTDFRRFCRCGAEQRGTGTAWGGRVLPVDSAGGL